MGLKRLLYEQSSEKPGWREMQVAWCGMLLVKLLRGRGETGEMKSIDRVRWYAEEMASSFYLNEGIDEAAERLGLSRRRFTQLFREVTGEPWLQRLRSSRTNNPTPDDEHRVLVDIIDEEQVVEFVQLGFGADNHQDAGMREDDLRAGRFHPPLLPDANDACAGNFAQPRFPDGTPGEWRTV